MSISFFSDSDVEVFGLLFACSTLVWEAVEVEAGTKVWIDVSPFLFLDDFIDSIAVGT